MGGQAESTSMTEESSERTREGNEPPRARRWLGSAARATSLVLLSTTIALLLAEGMVRLAAPQQLILRRPDVWQPVDSLGWRLRPDVATTINTGERTVSVFTDADGFRVGSRGRASDGLRLLLLGDSFMEAMQVEYEQSLAGLIETELRLGDAGARVWNTGVGGWGPSQYSQMAQRMLAGSRWDGVLVMVYVGNDVEPRIDEYHAPRQPSVVRRFRIPRGLGVSELVDAILYPVNDLLEVRSHLFVLVKSRLRTLLMSLGLSAAEFDYWYFRESAGHPAWNRTADRLAGIAASAREHDTRTLFALIPSAFQVDEAVFQEFALGIGLDPARIDLDQPSRILLESLTARGLTVVDLLPGLRQVHALRGPLYGRIDRHLNPEGHRVVFELLRPELSELLSPTPAVQEGSIRDPLSHESTLEELTDHDVGGEPMSGFVPVTVPRQVEGGRAVDRVSTEGR